MQARKKLHLHKETVRDLTWSELGWIRGGTDRFPFQSVECPDHPRPQPTTDTHDTGADTSDPMILSYECVQNTEV
ncbi:MAG: hypothetical protein ACE5G2_03820 [Candidatus Krumholzibacteriia bacterium]